MYALRMEPCRNYRESSQQEFDALENSTASARNMTHAVDNLYFSLRHFHIVDAKRNKKAGAIGHRLF